MATSRVDNETKLTLRVNTGTIGNPTYKNRAFNHINPDLTDDKAYAVGAGLAGLQAHTLDKIVRTDTATLESDE